VAGNGDSRKAILSVKVANSDGCSDQIRRAAIVIGNGGGVGYRFAAREDRRHEPSQSVRPTVAGQPFGDVTGEQSGVPLSAGVTRRLVVALSRFRGLPSAQGATRPMCCRGVSTKWAQGPDFVATGVIGRGHACVGREYDIETTDLLRAAGRNCGSSRGAIEHGGCFDRRPRGRRRPLGRDLVRPGTLLFHRLHSRHAPERQALFGRARKIDPAWRGAIWLARVTGGLLAYGVDDADSAAPRGFARGDDRSAARRKNHLRALRSGRLSAYMGAT